MRVDLHQHVYTRPLLERLERRSSLPFARSTAGTTVVHAAGEEPFAVDPTQELASRRAGLLGEDGVDRALVAISSPLGIEALPRAEALELIEAHLEGVDALPEAFDPWGPVALDHLDPDDVDVVLEWGCAGVSLPAGALADRHALERLGPLLARAERRGGLLFVHPGPAPLYVDRFARQSGPAPGESAWSGGASPDPHWWPALTSYVSQMQAAWLTFVFWGRPLHPDLRVVFAMLAGCAPLQAERLAARSGAALDLRDPHIFYETSSYGPVALETMARLVGEKQLVYGSDRPVVTPGRTGREGVTQVQAGKLLNETRLGFR